MAHVIGDTKPITMLVDDDNGAVVVQFDADGDLFTQKFSGMIICDGAASIDDQTRTDGGGHFDGSVEGRIYTWHIQCGSFQGVHEVVSLKYVVGPDAAKRKQLRALMSARRLQTSAPQATPR